jgi:hypothetical protein
MLHVGIVMPRVSLGFVADSEARLAAKIRSGRLTILHIIGIIHLGLDGHSRPSSLGPSCQTLQIPTTSDKMGEASAATMTSTGSRL